jgi:hypothetical protein
MKTLYFSRSTKFLIYCKLLPSRVLYQDPIFKVCWVMTGLDYTVVVNIPNFISKFGIIGAELAKSTFLDLAI